MSSSEQRLCRNAIDHIKIFDNDDPGCKTFASFSLQFYANIFAFWLGNDTYIHIHMKCELDRVNN